MQSTVPPRFLAAGGSVCTDARTAGKACTGSGIRGPVQDVHDTSRPWFGVRSVPRDSLQSDPTPLFLPLEFQQRHRHRTSLTPVKLTNIRVES